MIYEKTAIGIKSTALPLEKQQDHFVKLKTMKEKVFIGMSSTAIKFETKAKKVENENRKRFYS